MHLVAPGICSYVAASCGGALGRLCLTTQQDPAEQEEDWTGAGWGDGWGMDGWRILETMVGWHPVEIQIVPFFVA